MDTSQDSRCRRCPRLGHEVSFKYCRLQGSTHVCPKILDCWWETFPVQEFLRSHLDAEEYSRLIEERPSKPKILSLMELIEQAKKRKGEGGVGGSASEGDPE